MNNLKNKTFQKKLLEAHFNLVKKTLTFIKLNYNKPISIKEDPNIFISLIEEYCSNITTKNTDICNRIIEKIETKRYIENSIINSELLHLIVLPYNTFNDKGHFTCLHLETLDPNTYDVLLNYFAYTEKEFDAYTSVSTKELGILGLRSADPVEVVKTIKSLKYNNACLWALRKGLDVKSSYQISLEAKHIFLTIQIILVEKTLKAETLREIYFFRNLLTDFLFFSKLVT